MYSFLSGLYKHLTRREAYYIVIIGLDNAGKTVCTAFFSLSSSLSFCTALSPP